jgi:septum formation protein
MSELFSPSALGISRPKSPRRQELLRQRGVEFDELLLREAPGRRRDMVEAPRKGEPPLEYVKRIARLKAWIGWHRMTRRGLRPKPVLGADTEVVVDGTALGKPKDAPDAITMLAALSDRTRRSHGGGDPLGRPAGPSRLDLARHLPRDPERRDQGYVATGEPSTRRRLRQGKAAAFVQHLEGSYSGVMGLPLFERAGILTRIGFTVL